MKSIGHTANEITHSWRADLRQRLTWLYGDWEARMTSPEAHRDMVAWRNIGRRKP